MKVPKIAYFLGKEEDKVNWAILGLTGNAS